MATILHVPAQPDPIHAAIAAHTEAWARAQVLPASVAGRARLAAGAALDALLCTSCETRFGALALLKHLRWLASAEGFTVLSDDATERAVLTRMSDLALFLGDDPAPVVMPGAVPFGVIAQRVARRLNMAGELLACLVLIGGGMAAFGFVTF